MATYIYPDGTQLSSAEYFGWKAEHVSQHQVGIAEDIDDLIFECTNFETEQDVEYAEYMRDYVRSELAEFDQENGNWYWLPEDSCPETWEAIEKALADPEAPEGLGEWYERH